MVKQEIPFDRPTADCKAPVFHKLDAAQQEKYDAVLGYLNSIKNLPVREKANETRPLDDSEKAWLSEECIRRYLRATKWNQKETTKRLTSTLMWRRTFGVDPRSTLTGDMVSQENETGKEVLLGYDLDARPCLYLRPGRQNTKASHTQVQHLVFMLERVIDFMVPGQEQLALIIDFDNTGLSTKMPSMSTGREVLSILQDHYPERLGKALLTNIPRVAKIFLKLIHPFIDPATREKLVFNQPFPKYVPSAQLMKEYGGDVNFEYNHAVYWPALIEMSKSRHEQFLQHWREAANGEIGYSESKLRESFDSNWTDSAAPQANGA